MNKRQAMLQQMQEGSPDSETIDELAEEEVQKLHKLDSLNILLFVGLLILTVLTIWLFKRRRARFIHETGLTMIFGLVIGALIRYTTIMGKDSTLMVVPAPGQPNMSSLRAPPATVVLKLRSVKLNYTSVKFSYKFFGEMISQTDSSFEEERATFNPEIFFNILLPPIMFNAGYSLKRRNFFRNIGTILTFALIGATVSCMVGGFLLFGFTKILRLDFELSQCLYFGALIASTDPVTVLAIFTDLNVDVDLFAIVFGESALNDAVALVLSQTIESYVPSNPDFAGKFDAQAFVRSIGNFFAVFLGSFGLGTSVGCLTALITKYTKIAEFPTLETALFFLMSYSSFLIAEVTGLTGIVAVLFCGICQAHYTFNNLSDESQLRTKQFFEMLNFLSENFIFAYIGVSLFTSEAHQFNIGFIAASFFAIAVGRAIFVYPFSALINLGRRPPIPINHQHMIFFAGLRGAIAFALAIRNTATVQRRMIYTTTSIIVILTVIVNGGLTMPMIQWLGIRYGDQVEADQRRRSFQRVDNSPGHGETDGAGVIVASEESPTRRHYNPWDKAFLPRKWYNFDSRFMKPLLTHSRPSLMETMPDCCLPLARWLTTTQQMMERSVNADGDAFSEADLVATNGAHLNSHINPHSAHSALGNSASSQKLNNNATSAIVTQSTSADSLEDSRYISFNTMPRIISGDLASLTNRGSPVTSRAM